MKYHVNDSRIGCDSARPPALKSFHGDKAAAAESVPAGAESSAEDAMNAAPSYRHCESGSMEIWLRRVYDRTEKGPEERFSLTGSGRGGKKRSHSNLSRLPLRELHDWYKDHDEDFLVIQGTL